MVVVATPDSPSAAALAAVSEAVLGVAGDLSVHTVLERLVHAARSLVSARYAAVGVPDDDGTGFAQFIHAGMSDELVDRIGPLPRTHGLLGSPAVRPRTAADPRRRRRPPLQLVAGGPPARCARSSACRSSSRATSSAPSTWPTRTGAATSPTTTSALIGVLAAHAAVAIENARLYEQSRELAVAGGAQPAGPRAARRPDPDPVQPRAHRRGRGRAACRTDPDRAESELATRAGPGPGRGSRRCGRWSSSCGRPPSTTTGLAVGAGQAPRAGRPGPRPRGRDVVVGRRPAGAACAAGDRGAAVPYRPGGAHQRRPPRLGPAGVGGARRRRRTR